jgi:hypothetical protein
MLRLLFAALMAVSVTTRARALDMSVVTNEEEKLAYLHMWGPIEKGDDQKFRSTILPYLREVYLLFQVHVFSGGGNVVAAMRIGDQIRTLQAMTHAPNHFINEPGYAQCWFVASVTHSGIGYDSKSNYKRNIKTNAGAEWYNCASACFLIWASGLTREGNYVGIHRFRFDEMYFGSLPVLEAKKQYKAAEKDFRDYLAKLNVPVTIVDRLFATDSKHMYYFSKSDLELVKSTPDVEEYPEAKCPPDKTKRDYYPDGRWKSTTFDPVRIACYREILKELMRAGVQKYLAGYAQAQADNPVPPEATPAPAESSEGEKKGEPATEQTKETEQAKKSFWAHNRSIMYMTEDGTRRQIYYDDPRPGLQEVGVRQGTLLFDGVADGTTLSGTAYVFAKDCHPLAFSAKGKLTREGKLITLIGKAPRIGTHCKVEGDKREELIFDFFR